MAKETYRREYIIEMSHIALKLKELKVKFPNDLLVHLVLILLPAHFISKVEMDSK